MSREARFKPRLPAVDAARGVAIVAMATYHTAWDLQFLQLAPVDAVGSPAWRAFAAAIAATFLALVGVSLVLASRDGPTPRPFLPRPFLPRPFLPRPFLRRPFLPRPFLRRPFLRRLGLVGGAAAAITVATYLATPDRFIFFGILHCIAVSSVLALPFLRAPLAVVGLAAAATFALPQVFSSPAFEAPALVWLGLGTDRPTTNDFVPIFPWFAPVLVGIAAARLALAHAATSRGRRETTSAPAKPPPPVPPPPVPPPATPDVSSALPATTDAAAGPPAPAWPRSRRADAGPLGWLALAGRHSLPIYLLHQPVILGLLWLVLQVTGPNPAAELASFTRACVPACLDTGDAEGPCRTACTCMADALKRESLWSRAMQSNLTTSEETRVADLAQQCRRAR